MAFIRGTLLQPRGAYLDGRARPYLLSWEETLGLFVGSTVRLLRSHTACQPGVLL